MQKKTEIITIRYFSDNILGEDAVLKHYGDGVLKLYQKTLVHLIQGRYRAIDLKQIKANRFTARINDTHRLLFTTVIENGQSHILLLAIILNHNYQKCKYLNEVVFKNYIKSHHQAILEHLKRKPSPSVSMSELGSELPQGLKINYSPRTFYNYSFIEFDEVQQGALYKKFPLVITGAPGSGKSCLALALMRKCFEVYDADTGGKILYLSNSTLLTKKMQEMWGHTIGDDNQVVCFKTYRELYQELCPNPKTLIDMTYFRRWIAVYIKTYKVLSKTKPQSLTEDFFTQIDLLYQEFRIIAAYSKEDYLALGQKQSLFNDNDKKAWLYEAFEKYQKHLDSIKQIDLGICDFRAELQQKVEYQYIILDEAQDLSHLQLLITLEMVQGRQICFCVDSNQTLYDYTPRLPFILDKLGKDHEEPVKLTFTYRCPLTSFHLPMTF